MAKVFDFSISGDKEILAALERLGPVAATVAGGALYRSGEEIATASKDKYVPVKTGNLQGTIHAEPAVQEGNEVIVKIVAGNAAIRYAVFVHEIKKNYNFGRQWKYLETPAKDASQDIVDELRQSLADALR